MATAERARRRLDVRGRVQGVGFRPFVERLAAWEALDGFVANVGAGVAIEIEGRAAALDSFARRLLAEAPPVALIDDVASTDMPPSGATGFRVSASDAAAMAGLPQIAPDRAICLDCAAAIRDPADRRFGHPFASCVCCGPRYTVIDRLPYDRINTTMAAFPLCQDCLAEYQSPGGRHGRAETLACPRCGPRLHFFAPGGPETRSDAPAFAAAADALRSGGVVAVKGIGGFHLMVRADDPAAVVRLRARKRRRRKPFAVMFANVAAVEALCAVDPVERAALTSPAAPIVLLERIGAGGDVCDAVAPGSRRLGAMLAYTPLHLMLLDAVGAPLVATSGNAAGAGIVYRDEDVATRLWPLVDAVLSHDRPIRRPAEDSIVQVAAGRLQTLRLGRGLSPLRLPLPRPLPAPALAFGGHWKAAPALGQAAAVLGGHIGDLEDEAALEALACAAGDFPGLHGAKPALSVLDLHPDAPAAEVADALGLQVHTVQHHVAHAAAVAAEHGLALPATALVWDGAGYGVDGGLWGGETLRLDDKGGWRRLGRLRPIPLLGGDAAIRDPRRIALSLAAEVAETPSAAIADMAGIDPEHAKLLLAMRQTGVGVAPSCGMGRLFDGLASLLGLAGPIDFEGEAAAALQAAAEDHTPPVRSYPLDWHAGVAGLAELDWRPLVRAVLADRAAGVSACEIAAAVHESLAAAAVAAATQAELEQVLLGGGCFQNRLLLERTATALRQAGFAPYWSESVPINDGGLAYGQLAWAAWETA